ncbi:hypothetical protein SISNIDRAFT_171616 [Sistotremastrum niveocremeum HHB9708]|uniref:MYND-type domain-containing protein n=1 Tax=Sistotremastrum niveocremeum HHB9708 TaxID=1314777 RepID=A0A164S529_9AGAM|nr:hypothetical protein SISNIDRAFT_171616 [Sistotremastrum niveocremeum HHB9708]
MRFWFKRWSTRVNLWGFIFYCHDLESDDTHFATLVFRSLLDLIQAQTPCGCLYGQAESGIPRLTREIPVYFDNPEVLRLIFTTLCAYLSSLSSYRSTMGKPLPEPFIEYITLPQLAQNIVDLLQTPRSLLLSSWDIFDPMSKVMAWIAYHQSSAILDLPDNAGLLLFITFLQSPSVVIRCRGMIGLVNMKYPDHLSEVRVCNPQLTVHLMSSSKPSKEVPTSEKGGPWLLPSDLPYETVSERYRNPLVKFLDNGAPFKAYEAALRVVEFELRGSQDVRESFSYPCTRLFGGRVALSLNLIDDMEIALRFHKKNFEATVLRLALLTVVLEDALDFGEKNPDVKDTLDKLPAVIKSESDRAIKKWPDRWYPYYAMIKSQSGHDYLDVAQTSQGCSDSTHRHKSLMVYEIAFNMFTTAVVSIALSPFESPAWEAGVRHLREAEGGIFMAMQVLPSGCVQHRMAQVLSCLLRLITRFSVLGPCELPAIVSELKQPLMTLRSSGTKVHTELRNAATEFVLNHARASKASVQLLARLAQLKQVAEHHRKWQVIYRDMEGDGQFQDDVNAYGEQELIARRLTQCAWCGRSSSGLRKCARCEKVKYCGKECQTDHWKQGHKEECVSPVITV